MIVVPSGNEFREREERGEREREEEREDEEFPESGNWEARTVEKVHETSIFRSSVVSV